VVETASPNLNLLPLTVVSDEPYSTDCSVSAVNCQFVSDSVESFQHIANFRVGQVGQNSISGYASGTKYAACENGAAGA
jgi:hypothetical protein